MSKRDPKCEQFNFRCEAEFLRRLKAAAKFEGKAVSKLIRESLMERASRAEKLMRNSGGGA